MGCLAILPRKIAAQPPPPFSFDPPTLRTALALSIPAAANALPADPSAEHAWRELLSPLAGWLFRIGDENATERLADPCIELLAQAMARGEAITLRLVTPCDAQGHVVDGAGCGLLLKVDTTADAEAREGPIAALAHKADPRIAVRRHDQSLFLSIQPPEWNGPIIAEQEAGGAGTTEFAAASDASTLRGALLPPLRDGAVPTAELLVDLNALRRASPQSLAYGAGATLLDDLGIPNARGFALRLHPTGRDPSSSLSAAWSARSEPSGTVHVATIGLASSAPASRSTAARPEDVEIFRHIAGVAALASTIGLDEQDAIRKRITRAMGSTKALAAPRLPIVTLANDRPVEPGKGRSPPIITLTMTITGPGVAGTLAKQVLDALQPLRGVTSTQPASRTRSIRIAAPSPIRKVTLAWGQASPTGLAITIVPAGAAER